MPRTTLTSRLLIASLAVNVLVLSVATHRVIKKGGWPYLIEVVTLADIDFNHNPFQEFLISRHRKLPNTADEIIFLGDSITLYGPWADVFSKIKNRGIGGDTTPGTLARLDEITESRPKKVFLNIGTNDLKMGISLDRTLNDYQKILTQFAQDSPDTRVYVISVLPVNTTEYKLSKFKNSHIIQINEGLKRLTKASSATYLNLNPEFTNSNGELRSDLTMDGLHLTVEGYLHYCKLIESMVLN